VASSPSGTAYIAVGQDSSGATIATAATTTIAGAYADIYIYIYDMFWREGKIK
jgi:hypothetical protein